MPIPSRSPAMTCGPSCPSIAMRSGSSWSSAGKRFRVESAATLAHRLAMKKLATVIAFVSSAVIAAPVFACPGMDHDAPQIPRTAQKAKDAKDTKGQDTAKAKDDASKGADQKPADTAKAKDTTKKPDKVSSK